MSRGINTLQTLGGGSPPFLILPLSLLPLLIQLGFLGSVISSPSGSGQSPATKHILVHSDSEEK